MNTRNVYGKRLFSRATFLMPGSKVTVHLPRMAGKHLVCRVAQVNNGQHTLHCKRGTLSERFVASQLQHCKEQGESIPLDKWRQSEVFSVKEVGDDDTVNCYCRLARNHDCVLVESDEDNHRTDEDGAVEDGAEIQTPLYTLLTTDMNTIHDRYGWLNDNVIAASQKLLLQHFPQIGGLQLTTLQQVRGFVVHRSEFVQIINVDSAHWCVVSNIDCKQGEVNIFDTMYTEVQSSSIPIIASLVFCNLPSLKMNSFCKVLLPNRPILRTAVCWQWPLPSTYALVWTHRQYATTPGAYDHT